MWLSCTYIVLFNTLLYSMMHILSYLPIYEYALYYYASTPQINTDGLVSLLVIESSAYLQLCYHLFPSIYTFD